MRQTVSDPPESTWLNPSCTITQPIVPRSQPGRKAVPPDILPFVAISTPSDHLQSHLMLTKGIQMRKVMGV